MNRDGREPRTSVVGVLGATSLVGRPLLRRLAAAGRRVVACSRRAAVHAAPDPTLHGSPDVVTWRVTGTAGSPDGRPSTLPDEQPDEHIADWVALCPMWALPEHSAWLESLGVERIVAVSSQSLVTKRSSPHAVEREVAARLATAEAAVVAWAAARGITLCILRTTMIYDGIADGNVAAIAAFLERPPLGIRGFFPVCGPAGGLRQPVHADDVAAACGAALDHPAPAPIYAISGGEALPYRTMVERIGQARGCPVRTVAIPRAVWRVAEAVARRLGRARSLPPGAASRMNVDLSCDHGAAARDLQFRPRSFQP
jgi:nucleoside-diphosphate-sugar epimerase